MILPLIDIEWFLASSAYRNALDASEKLYEYSELDISKKIELVQSNDLYRRVAYAYAQINELEEAVVVLEKGRGQALSESLETSRYNSCTQLDFAAIF